VNRAVYIELPDGTRLAADIRLPASGRTGDRVGTLVSFTRYWRARVFEPSREDEDECVEAILRWGYAAVVVDARGSGASFGSRAAEFSPCETRDFKHVIEWIAAQPWSNGRVATIGVSYSGNTAEHAAYDPTSALVAAVPRFTDFDAYASILFPGGLRNALITETWAAGVNALDNNRVPDGEWRGDEGLGGRLLGVKPVDDDHDGTLLARAVDQHGNNQDFFAMLSRAEFRDDLSLTGDLTSPCETIVTPYLLSRSRQAGVPCFHWGSWMDAGTAAGVLARFASNPNDAHHVIGAWNHGGSLDANVFRTAPAQVPSNSDEQNALVADFLAPLLRVDTVAAPRTGLSYFTMGENVWKHTSSWPIAGSTAQQWYLAPLGALRTDAPTADDGADQYTVEYTAGTGSTTRWSTQLGGTDVFYGDRREADLLLLTYTSPPLAREIEITGHPLVELFVASTHADGALIAYLETVAPDGRVVMITEGQLRLIHRRVSVTAPPYPMFGPHHSFERQDALPMVPGEIAAISFAMLPTSVRIPRGHCLRLAIAGHDRDCFFRYPAAGTPTLEVFRSGAYPSSLTLPVIDRSIEALRAC
jgi:putative CocE/NonD family hydrolase